MTRTVLNADALPWLRKARDQHLGAIITSLPDAEEINAAIDDWRVWFSTAVELCMRAAHAESCAIFYQTDRKLNSELISKAQLVLEQADRTGMRLLWHKIVLRHAVGSVDLYRPTFTHMLAFSREMKTGAATPDVIESGNMIYKNAMGLKAAEFAIKFACRDAEHIIIDPFCGRGSVLAVANVLGYDSIGIDIDDQQCKHARECVTALQQDLL